MSKKLFVATAAMLMSTATLAERNSFVLSAGAGFGMNNLEIDNSYNPETEASSGFIRSFKIGGLINQQHALYLHIQSTRFDIDYEDSSGSATFEGNSAGLLGLGYTYYLKPEVGSAYVEASVGRGNFNIDDTINGQTIDLDSSGMAFLIGAGYEFNEHVQLGVSYQMGDTENDNKKFDESYSYSTLGAKVEIKL